MKKLFCMILALIMVMSLCACGKKPSNHGQNDSFVNGNGTNQNAHTGNANDKAIQAALIGKFTFLNLSGS